MEGTFLSNHTQLIDRDAYLKWKEAPMVVETAEESKVGEEDVGHKKKKKMNLKRSNSDMNNCWSNLPASCRLEKSKKLRPARSGK